MSRLHVLPEIAWLQVKDRELPPITFYEYCIALDRIPQTSYLEIGESESDATLASILFCRTKQVEMLRARWLKMR